MTPTSVLADGFHNRLHDQMGFDEMWGLLHDPMFRKLAITFLKRVIYKADYGPVDTTIRVFLSAWPIRYFPARIFVNQASEHREPLIHAATEMVSLFSNIAQSLANGSLRVNMLEPFVDALDAYVEIFDLWVAADRTRLLAVLREAIRVLTDEITADAGNTHSLHAQLTVLRERERQLQRR